MREDLALLWTVGELAAYPLPVPQTTPTGATNQRIVRLAERLS